MPATCFICDGESFVPGMSGYRRCLGCGHETLAAEQHQTFMLNEPLTRAAVERVSSLDQFQSSVLRKCMSSHQPAGVLVDIGSGAGKFLLHNQTLFAQALGIEVTTAAVNFSRNTLGLNIERDIADVTGEIDVATAWHSLEHFPTDALIALLDQLAQKLARSGRIIVSVPNAASFQARWFGSCFAFRDVPNHLHQFSPQSLERLFAEYGFARSSQHVSWPYNAFGYIQAILNLVSPQHNYIYYRLKRGSRARSLWCDILAIITLPIALPVGLMLSVLDALVQARAGVLTWCFEKRA